MMHRVTADQSVVKRRCQRRERKVGKGEEEEEEKGHSSEFEIDCRMCIPGDNRVKGSGLFSVQMTRKRRTY